MQIPSLPTDNFYKFFALGGLLATIASMYLIVDFTMRLEDRSADHEAEIAILELDADHAATAQEKLEIQRRAAAAEAKIKRMGTHLVWARNFLVGTLVIGILGLVASAWGFRRWYRLQALQDELFIAEHARRQRQARDSDPAV